MRTVDSGSYAASAPSGREAFSATNEASFSELWRTRMGNANVPRVDFSREAAVLLMAEEQSSGGWSIVPEGVRLEGNVLVVKARVEGPPAGSITSQALTQPWVVLAVTPASFDSVRWDRAERASSAH